MIEAMINNNSKTDSTIVVFRYGDDRRELCNELRIKIYKVLEREDILSIQEEIDNYKNKHKNNKDISYKIVGVVLRKLKLKYEVLEPDYIYDV
jgi:hypothetical protein